MYKAPGSQKVKLLPPLLFLTLRSLHLPQMRDIIFISHSRAVHLRADLGLVLWIGSTELLDPKAGRDL